jgi:hypothetical protein
LERLREHWPEGRGVREFVRILRLHQSHPDEQVAAAVDLAVHYGCPHYDGVVQCLRQLTCPQAPPTSLDLSDRPHLQTVGTQPVDLQQYDQLLHPLHPKQQRRA